MIYLAALAWLLIGHALADGPLLNPSWLSRMKRDPLAERRWSALALHGAAHGFAVTLVLGAGWIGTLEMAAHMGIDRCKGRGLLGTWQDQALHVGCKCIWIMLWVRHG